jgi:hypothetical protein
MLTEGLVRAGVPCRVVDDEIRRRVGEELGDGVDAGLHRAPGFHSQAQGTPADVWQGSGRTETRRQHGIAVAELLTGDNVWCNSDRCMGRGRG